MYFLHKCHDFGQEVSNVFGDASNTFSKKKEGQLELIMDVTRYHTT